MTSGKIMASMLVLVAVLLAWIPLRNRPGIGTVANVIVIAVTVDLALWLLPTPASMTVRIALMLGAVVLLGGYAALIVGADALLGLDPAMGGGLFAVAGVIALYSSFFLFFALAEMLASWMHRGWAFLIVFLIMLALAGLLAFIGFRKIKKIKAPEKTIESVNELKNLVPGQAKKNLAEDDSALYTGGPAPTGRPVPPRGGSTVANVD